MHRNESRVLSTKIYLTIFVFSFAFLISNLSLAASTEEQVFPILSGYLKALEANNGKEASTYVSRGTIEYYEEVRLHSLSLGKNEFLKAPFIHRMNILVMRAMYGTEELKAIDGKVLFESAIDRGLVGDNLTKVLSYPRKFETGDGRTWLMLQFPGQQNFVRVLPFDTEESNYRLDLAYTLFLFNRTMETIFANAAKEAKTTLDDYMMTLAKFSASQAGRAVDFDLMEPLL